MRSPPITPQQHIDVQMQSPTQNLQGASRMTGGTFCGQALGNVYNFADKGETLYELGYSELGLLYFVDEHVFNPVPVQTGKVLIYESFELDAKPEPLVDKPSMSIKHQVSDSLVPVLQKLSIQYSPVQHEC